MELMDLRGLASLEAWRPDSNSSTLNFPNLSHMRNGASRMHA
jgi:hypothetical protein